MATAVTSCAPCVFGALETSLLSLPYDIVGTINVIELPQTFTRNGTVSTTTLTSTLDVPQTSFIIGPPGASQSIVPVTLDGANPTWSTLGTVLTYPTTYVQYLAFQGAAVTSPATACAQTLAPTSLALPTSTEAASYIFPQDNSTNAIPIELLDYLDSDGSIPAQLDGDQLTTCAALGAAPVAASTAAPNITLSITPSVRPITTTSSEVVTTSAIVSTSFSTSTTILTSTSTIETVTETSTSEAESTAEESSSIVTVASSAVEVTLTSSTLIPAATTSLTLVTTQTVTKTPALVINTITGPVIIIPTTPATAAPAAAESMTTEASSSELFSNLVGLIGSLTASTSTSTSTSTPTLTSTSRTPLAPYVNSTAASITSSAPSGGAGAGNASTTSYTVPYTGAASHISGRSVFGGFLGFLAALLVT